MPLVGSVPDALASTANYLRKAGWADFADRQYPFLIDTDLFCWHINPDGTKYPLELQQWQR